MKLFFYSIAVIAMCLFMAYSNSDNDKKSVATQDIILPKTEETEPVLNMSADTASFAANTAEDIPLQSGGTPTYTDWDKKIVKTAMVKLEAKDYNTFNSSIHNSIKGFGAYIAGEQQSQSETLVQNNLTLKVPVDQFDALLNSIGGDGIQIISKDISTDDVSTELIDTKARIEAKKQLRDKYSELLQQAKSMKDILQVQSEINNIQEELEAAAGRVNYLSHSAAYSTVTISYFQYLNGNTSDNSEPTFFTKIKEAFATGGSVFTHIVLLFVSIWPLLLAGTILYVYFKKGKSKKVTV